MKISKQWHIPPVDPNGFHFEIEMNAIDSRGEELTRKSIAFYDLGSPDRTLPKGQVEEWDFSFCHLDGRLDGANRFVKSWYDPDPVDRKDALAQIRTYVYRQYNALEGQPWRSMTGHYPWQHYAADFGALVVGSEIGESIYNYQTSVAFNRGAARQYGIAWYIDYSAWSHSGIEDYSETKIWGQQSGVDNGHSHSLKRRLYLMSYMAGASYIIAEAGAAISFYDDVDPATGVLRLSPYGEICREFNAFTKKLPDVGVTCTPFGVVLDHYHGMPAGEGLDIAWSKQKAFQFFDLTDGDRFNRKVIETFFPDTFHGYRQNDEKRMVNSPYGDTVDFLTHIAPQEVLNSYPCLILAGDPELTDEEKRKFVAYVQQGGTLLLNEAYLPLFPAFDTGAGEVKVYGPAYEVEGLKPLLEEQLKKHIPFSFSEPVSYIVNAKENTLLVTVMNNAGVSKLWNQPTVTDHTKDMRVTVTYTGGEQVCAVRERYRDAAVSLDGQSVTVNLPAGESVVLEFNVR